MGVLAHYGGHGKESLDIHSQSENQLGEKRRCRCIRKQKYAEFGFVRNNGSEKITGYSKVDGGKGGKVVEEVGYLLGIFEGLFNKSRHGYGPESIRYI